MCWYICKPPADVPDMGRLIADLEREDTMTLPLEVTGEPIVIQLTSMTMQVNSQMYGNPIVLPVGRRREVLTEAMFRDYLVRGRAYLVGPYHEPVVGGPHHDSPGNLLIFFQESVEGVVCIIMHPCARDLAGAGAPRQ